MPLIFFKAGMIFYLVWRYFTKQDLKELFELSDTRVSVTQQQLEKLQQGMRKTDTLLDSHIAFLYSLGTKFSRSSDKYSFADCLQQIQCCLRIANNKRQLAKLCCLTWETEFMGWSLYPCATLISELAAVLHSEASFLSRMAASFQSTYLIW